MALCPRALQSEKCKTKPIADGLPEFLNKTNGAQLTEHDLKNKANFPEGKMTLSQ